MFRCARIQGLDTYEGLLLFGKDHVYIVDGFTLLKTREIRDIDTLLPNSYEPLLPSPGNGSPNHVRIKKQSSKFSYDDIRYLNKPHYNKEVFIYIIIFFLYIGKFINGDIYYNQLP